MKGGPKIWELIRFAQKHILSIAGNDIRWVKKTDHAWRSAPLRSEPGLALDSRVRRPRHGMVNFPDHFAYLKSIGFAGSFLHYSEYFVDVPGATADQHSKAQRSEGHAQGTVPQQRAQRLRLLLEDARTGGLLAVR